MVAIDTRTLTVTFGGTYGSLPTPERSGYGFRGWWTEQEGGTQVTASTTVSNEEDHTLYAHWVELKPIPSSVFDFGTAETVTYDRSGHTATYTFNPDSVDCPEENSFTISYTRVSDEYIGENLDAGEAATMAGTYNVTIHRDADDTYTTFDQNYTNVLVIQRATRDLSSLTNDDLFPFNADLTQFRVNLTPPCRERIDVNTDSEQLYYEFDVSDSSNTYRYDNHEIERGLIYDLTPGTTYTITA